MKIEDIYNKETKFTTEAFAEAQVKDLQVGEVVQFERRGFYKVDKQINSDCKSIEMIYIPEGKQQKMSKLKGKVSAKEIQGQQKMSKKAMKRAKRKAEKAAKKEKNQKGQVKQKNQKILV